jgi:L-lactate dehydrogenase complex protein LldG
MNAERPATTTAQATGDGDAGLTGFLRELRSAVPADAACTALPEIGDVVRQVAPPPNSSTQDLVERFAAAATAVGMQVHRTSPSQWIDGVREVLRGCNAKTVFLAAQRGSALSDDRAGELIAALHGDGIAVRTTPNDETLFNVDAAITGVSAAVAETGTIVCTSGPGLARGASLIPPVHVAVVSAEQLLADLYDYLAPPSDPGDLPANTNLITGPSKTADIEGILITGVHGPGKVHVVLLS